MISELNSQLKVYFSKDKIVFGGSQVFGDAQVFSDVDIYLVCGPLKFFYYLNHKNELRKVKKELNNSKVNLHIIPSLFLSLGLYSLKGIYFSGTEKKVFSTGSHKLIELNSLKLCFKHLLLLKLSDEAMHKDKSLHDLKKNFFFLAGYREENVVSIETELKEKVKIIKTFFFFDWLFYCLRFRKVMPFNFEKIILNSFVELNNFIETRNNSHCQNFYQYLSKLKRKVSTSCDFKTMLNQLDRYTFLIFVV